MGLSTRLSWVSLLKIEHFISELRGNVSLERYLGKTHCDLPGHLLYALRPVVFIVHVTRDVFQVVHVWANQHGPQLDEITMGLILHCDKIKACTQFFFFFGWNLSSWLIIENVNLFFYACTLISTEFVSCKIEIFVLTFHNAPWVKSPSHPLTFDLNYRVAPNHSKWSALLKTQHADTYISCF